jgi:hypothetical protein
MAERGVQQLESVGGKGGAGGSDFWRRELLPALGNRWIRIFVVLLAVAAHAWLPSWWVGHFPDITQPIELSSEDESRITDYFVANCPDAKCEKSPHIELLQIADGLVSMVREDIFFGEHRDIASEMKDIYRDPYVNYVVYEFFDLTVRPCFHELQASREAVGRAPGAGLLDALDDLARTKPSCAFLRTSLSQISPNERLRSDIIQAYGASFSRVKDELGFRLAENIYHRSADALDKLSTWVSGLPDKGISEQDVTNAQNNIHVAGQLIELHVKLKEVIENNMYQEQRQDQKRRWENGTLIALFALVLVFSPVLPEVFKLLIHLFTGLHYTSGP